MLKNIRERKFVIIFPQIKSLEECTLVTYSDSSYNNLGNGHSQGSLMVFLNGKNNNLTPLMWQSKQISQVVKSTMAAETLALVDAAEASFWLSKLFCEFIGLKKVRQWHYH